MGGQLELERAPIVPAHTERLATLPREHEPESAAGITITIHRFRVQALDSAHHHCAVIVQYSHRAPTAQLHDGTLHAQCAG